MWGLYVCLRWAGRKLAVKWGDSGNVGQDLDQRNQETDRSICSLQISLAKQLALSLSLRSPPAELHTRAHTHTHTHTYTYTYIHTHTLSFTSCFIRCISFLANLQWGNIHKLPNTVKKNNNNNNSCLTLKHLNSWLWLFLYMTRPLSHISKSNIKYHSLMMFFTYI